MSRVPRIRFKGFEEDWEQRKLGEMCQITMGQSPDGSTYSETPSDFILVQGNADLKDGWIFPRIWTTQKTKTADAGDLIMSVRAPAGAMGKTAYNVVLGRGVAGIKGNEFIYQSLVNMDSDGYWKKLAAGSTFESINSDVVNGAELIIPQDIEEQIQIGSFFANLDHLITLHQSKSFWYILKSIVSCTLYWEQRKFDEVFDCTIPNNTLSRAELNYDSGSVRNVHYGDILIKYGSVVDVQNDEIPFATGKSSDDFKDALLQDGDIIIADTAEDETTGKACEIGNLQGVDVVSGLHTMVCRPRKKMALGYLGYYLNSDAYHHQLLPLMQGIKVLSLSKTNVQKTIVYYPKNKAEQELIAGSFRNLDNLITLHQLEPYNLIFKAIAYRIIDYAKSKPPRCIK